MPAPSVLPEWASGGGADVVEPGSGKKALGWVDGEAPPAEYFNWLGKQTYLWLQWFSQLLTAAAAGDVTLNGSFIGASTSASTAAFSVTQDAHDHPSSASNRWKLILEAPTADARRVRLYAGEGPSSGSFWALTLNAVWNPASGAQTWSKDDTGSESNLLRGVSGELHWYGRQSGAGTWTDDQWDDQGRGNLKVGDTVSSGALVVQGAGEVGASGSGDLLVHGAVKVTGAGGSFQYSPASTRIIPVQMHGIDAFVSGSNGALGSSGLLSPVQIPLAVPSSSGGCSVQVMYRQNSTTPASYKIVKRTANWAAPTAATETTVAGPTNTASVVGYNTLTLNIATVDTSAEYRLIMTPGDNLDSIEAIRATLTDGGPVNTM